MTRIKTLPGRALALWIGGTLTLGGAVAWTLPGAPTASGAAGQDAGQEADEEKADDDKLDLGEFNPFKKQPAAEPSPQQEMIRLFQEVEGRMNKMGSLLFDASKGETEALGKVGASGMDEIPRNPGDSSGGGGGALADLLNASRSEGASVLEGIDQILEIAKNQGGGT